MEITVLNTSAQFTGRNLALGKSSLQSSTLWSYEPDLAVDSDPDSCSFTPRSTDQRWWQVHLGSAVTIQSVAVTISPDSYQHFTIFVIGERETRQPPICPRVSIHQSCVSVIVFFQSFSKATRPCTSLAPSLRANLSLRRPFSCATTATGTRDSLSTSETTERNRSTSGCARSKSSNTKVREKELCTV